VSVLGICDLELVELFGFAARTSEGAVVSWEKEGGDNAVDSKLLALAVMDHAADAMRTDLMTITRHVLNEQSKFPEARGDLTILLNNIVLGCKFVCSSVSKVSQLTRICLSYRCIVGIDVWYCIVQDLTVFPLCHHKFVCSSVSKVSQLTRICLSYRCIVGIDVWYCIVQDLTVFPLCHHNLTLAQSLVPQSKDLRSFFF